MPVVSYDYGFLSDKDEKYVKEGRKSINDVTRLLIGRDSKSKMLLAHVIPKKGIHHGSWNFERVNEDLGKLGYKRLVLKNDKEPAIVAQVREAQRVAEGVEIVKEMSHTGGPQSNGDAEQAVRTVKSKTISVIATLERALKKKIPLSLSSDGRMGRAVRCGLRQQVCDGPGWDDGDPESKRRQPQAASGNVWRNCALPDAKTRESSMGR